MAQGFYIYTDFLSTCSFKYWKRSVEIFNYSGLFVHSSFMVCFASCILNTQYVLYYLFFKIILCKTTIVNKYYYYILFTGKKTYRQKSFITCQNNIQCVRGLSEPRHSDSRNYLYSKILYKIRKVNKYINCSK